MTKENYSAPAAATVLTDEQIDLAIMALQEVGEIAQAALGPKKSSAELRTQFKRIFNVAQAGIADVERLLAHLAGQSQATRAVPDLHNAIMNLPCERTMSHFPFKNELLAYKEGHRDARHAAAELVSEAEAAQEVTQQAATEAPTISAHNLSDAEIDSITRYFSQDKYYDSIRACVAFATERLEQRLEYVMRDSNGPTHFGEPVIAAPVAQQVAKAETAEQAKPVAWMRDNMRECKTDADVKQMASLEFGCWKEIAALYTIPLYLAPTTSTVSAPEGDAA